MDPLPSSPPTQGINSWKVAAITLGIGILAILAIGGGMARSLPTHLSETGDQHTAVPSQVSAGNCFNNSTEPITKLVSSSAWSSYESLGYALKYPADKVKIERSSQNPDEITIASLDGSARASVSMLQLTSSMGGSSVFQMTGGASGYDAVMYEPLSNQWWVLPFNYQGWKRNVATQCNPNSIGVTAANGFPIYAHADGDVGAWWADYHVLLRDFDAPEEYDCWQPLVVTFNIAGNANSPGDENIGALRQLVEQIIQTVEVRPVCKG